MSGGVQFHEAVEDITGGSPKLPRSEYRQAGRLPVIDQGKGLISGYTDDHDYTFRHAGQHVIFGDHTRVVKYVDVPFVMGADGVKVLRARRDFDPKYVYHYLRTVTLPDAGYSRHFKFLKEVRVPKPPLDEQRRIAAILDHADAIRMQSSNVIAEVDQLEQAIFIEMFGEPISNPHGHSCERLGAVGTLDRGVSKHRPRNDAALLGGPYPLIQTGDVARSGGTISTYTTTYSELGLAQSKMWPAGTLCITIAANIAQTGVLAFDACFPDSVVGFTADESTTAYVRTWFTFLQATLEAAAPQSAQRNINLAILRDLPVPLPPAADRERFHECLRKVQEVRTVAAGRGQQLEELFGSLQSRAFAGQL